MSSDAIKPEPATEDWTPAAYPIPNHWTYVDFEQAFENIALTGMKIPQKEYEDSGEFPVIDQGAQLIGGYTNDSDKVLQISRSAIVFGDHTKCFKFVSFPFAPGADGVKVLVPRDNVIEKYALYACQSLRLPDRGYSRHYSFLKKSKFPLPPVDEQKSIVDKIETLFSELDKGIESLKAAREQLKVYRQAVLKHAFEGKFTAQWREENNCQAWKTMKLGKLLSFLTSGSRGWAAYYADEGDIFIRAQNLKYDRLDLEDIAFVSLPEKSEGKRTKVQVGDLLITITGANVTKLGYVKEDLGDAYVSQHVALCRPGDEISTEFLYWYLVAEAAGRGQLNKSAYGAGKPGLNLDNIRSVDVPLPDLVEQNVIAKKIEELLSVEENNASSIDNEIGRVEALRQSILKEAFSGQLVSKNSKNSARSTLRTHYPKSEHSQVASRTEI